MAKSRASLIKGLTNGDLKFFINTGVKNELRREEWIGNSTKLYHNIKLKEETNFNHPHFILKSDEELYLYNYCYYYNTKSFYHITGKILLPQGQMEIMCDVDPLFTNQNEIMDFPVFEDRGTNVGTKFIEDKEIIFNASPQAKVVEFYPTDGVGFNGESYMLGIANCLSYKGTEQDHHGTNYLFKDTSRENIDIIGAMITQIEQWREAHWSYRATSARTTYGYVDCSSLIARALKAALNDKNPFYNDHTSNSMPTVRGIAKWFYDNKFDYTIEIIPVSDGHESELNCLMTGDLLFYPTDDDGSSQDPPGEDRTHGFPFNDDNALDDIFGSRTDSKGNRWRGSGHISMVYRGCDMYDIDYDTIPALAPYDMVNMNISGQMECKVTGSYYRPTSDLWVLESLPQKARNFLSYDTTGNVSIWAGKDLDIKSGDGILWRKMYPTDNKWSSSEHWADTGVNIPYFAIRPNYKALYEWLNPTQPQE